MIKKELIQNEQSEKRNKSEEKTEMNRKKSIRIFSSVEEVLKEHSNTVNSSMHSSLPFFNPTHHGHSSSSSNIERYNTVSGRDSNISNTSSLSASTLNVNNLIITNHFMNSVRVDRDYITNNFDLLTGETLIDFEEAFYKREEINLIGAIVMTDYRLIFKFKDNNLQEKLNYEDNYFKIPLFQIAKIEKSHEKKNMSNYSLVITTKDFRAIKFIVMSDQLKLFANLNIIALPKDHSLFYTFAYKYREGLSGLCKSNSLTEDWKLYDPIKEFQRQGINFYDDEFQLKISSLNKNYALCPTYPEFLILPKSISDEEIREASQFRTKNRLPALAYIYSGFENNNLNQNCSGTKYSYASIWRSSQTKSGLSGQNRSLADEKLLKAISQLNEKLVIYDARPYINALANRMKGGGFENVNNYYKTELHFCQLENIHNVRNSLNKLCNLCNSGKVMNNKKFLSTLEDTNWYEYIHMIIKSSMDIVSSIKNNYSVLVHCSDGWDRSTQLVSLSQVLIDPYYRTIEGIIVLIEKDWLSFGHQFALRNGIYSKEMSEDQRAPIFLQWLDCLHQLIVQFPNAFEFNMEFLLFLASQYNSNLYGTFLYNNELERLEKEAKWKTVSIWSDILLNIKKYKNPFYQLQPFILSPNYAPYKMRLWEEFFLRWNNNVEGGRVYKDYNTNQYFKHLNEFFVNEKKQDKKKINNLLNKIKEMYNVLEDINTKTENTETYDQFDNMTQMYLTYAKDVQETNPNE